MYVGLLTASSLVGAVSHWFEYESYCPSGLEHVSKKARRIAHLQRLKWEYELTKSLLAERLGPIDRECRDLLNGREFVYATPLNDISGYLLWIETRISNMTQMIKVAADLLTQRLAAAMMSTRSKIAEPKEILGAVESIERFYRATVDFERSARAVIPPQGFEYIHNLQIGWAEPLREAILQAFQRIEQICDIDPHSAEELNLVFDFRTPGSFEEFSREAERLRAVMSTDSN